MADNWKAGLPAGILWNCASRLERGSKSESLKHLRLVCKQWCAEVNVNITTGTYDPDKCSPMLVTLPKMGKLERLTVVEASGDLLLSDIQSAKSFLPVLSSVSFSGCALDDSPIPMSSALQGISELKFIDCRLPQSTQLWFLESLASLTICFYPDDDGYPDDYRRSSNRFYPRGADLKYGVVRIPALENLSLSFVDVGEWEFGRMSHLTRVDLYCCDIDDDDMIEIGKISGLKHVSARFCNHISDSGMLELPCSLETIDIRDSDGVETTDWLPRLVNLSSLSFSINEDEDVDAKLSKTRRMRSLHVDVEASSLTGEGFDALAKHSNITSMALSIQYGSCTSVKMKGTLMASLVSLSCSWCYNTDEFLRTLSGCSSLARVNLTTCSHLTDAGLRSLPRSVTCLKVDAHSGITEAGLRALREMLPDLEVQSR